MKNNAKIVYFGVIALALILVASVCFGIIPNDKDVTNVYAEIVGSTISDSYQLGDSLVIPQTAIIRYEGGSYEGTFASMIGPDGSGTQGRKHTIEQVGLYTVYYNFKVSGETKQTSKTFNVSQENWSVELDESSVEYGKINTHANTNGLTLTLSRGDTFTFSQPIKLAEEGATNLITFFPEQIARTKSHLPADQKQNAGDYDAQRLIVTLTDCYNPDIFIDLILFFDLNPDNGTNARVRSYGQGEYGLVSSAGAINTHHLPTVVIDGYTYGYWKGQWGSGVSSGLDNAVTNLTWTFDQNSNQVHLITATPDKDRLDILVNDLDNKEITPNVFPGFTTGDVYLSISAADYINTTTTFQIESIGQFSGEELGAEQFIDGVAPYVQPLTDNATGAIFAQTNMEFPLFDAVAYDANLVGGVSEKVYYNYGTSMQSSVLVRDGKFIPEQKGIYTIEYSARDAYGNVGKATVPISVVDTPVVNFETTKVTSAVAGVAIELPKYTLNSKNGDVKLTITATAPDGTVTEINPNNSLFTLINVGTYTITYTYGDKIRSYEYSYQLNVQANSSYGFIEMPNLQEFYIKGISYQIDAINAYSFGDKNPKPTATEAYVSFDGGSYQKIDDLTNVVISGSNTVQFKYVAGQAVLETEKVAIRDVGYNTTLQIASYFDGAFTADAQYSYVDFTSQLSEGSNQLVFANKIATKLFSTKFALPNKLNQFTSFDVTLADDNGNKLTLSYYNVDGVLTVSINGKEVTLPGSLNDGVDRTVSYDADANAFVFVDINGTVTIPYDVELGDYAKLSYTFKGLTGNATVRIINILNQLICVDGFDYFAPQIYMQSAKGYAEVNTTSVANAAVAGDVLSPIKDCDFTLSVIAPDGSYAVDENGLTLENVSAKISYVFPLKQFGDYTVEYNVKDSAGRTAFNAYVVTSADVTAPTITFKGNVDESTVQQMKVGYKYSIKEFTVEDNDTAAKDLEVHIFVYNSNGQLLFADVTEITPTYEGRYIVYVYCLDSAGNSAYATYQIEVVAGDK